MNSTDYELAKKSQFGENSMLGFDEGVDRICDLPDDILCKILRLLPTNCAARTSILSTRWKDLFSLTNNLNLDFDDCPVRLLPVTDSSAGRPCLKLKFIDFVYRCFVVLPGNVKDINKFKLRTHQKYDNLQTHLNNWIGAALDFNIKEVDLEIAYTRSGFLLPAGETLTVLKLKGFMNIRILDSVGLPNLKVLHFVGVSITCEDLKRISRECRVLEELVLKLMDNFTVVDISAPALKRVTIDRIFDEDAQEIDLALDAPSVEYFYYNDDLPTSISANFQSLVEAHVRICAYCNSDGEDVNSLTELVNVCQQARVLTLPWRTLRGILHLDPSSLYVFHNLKHLVLGEVCASEWTLLPNLLQNSPNLETLVFEESFSKLYSSWSTPGTFLPLSIPSCVSSHLTSVGIKEFEGAEYELQWVKYFLAAAEVLQNMRISIRKGFVKPCKLTEKLLKLPRSSKECRIVVTSDFE